MVPWRDLLDHSPRPRRLRGLRGFCWWGKAVVVGGWSLVVGSQNPKMAAVSESHPFDIVHNNFRLGEYVSDVRSEVKMFPAILVLQANGGSSSRFGCCLTPLRSTSLETALPAFLS